MWIDSTYSKYYRRFADDSFWMSLSDAWMDHMYQSPWFLADQCFVSRVVGLNSDDARNRLNQERYTNVFADPPGVDVAGRSHRVKYINGCDPDGMPEL